MDSMSGHELIESQSAASPVSPLRPAPIPSSQMMAASQYYATPPPPPLQYNGREVANSATKAKLASGNGTGTGKSGSDHKTSDQVVTDQAREILRQAMVSGLVENAAAAAAVAAAAKNGAGSAPNAKSEGAARYYECQKNHAAGIGGHALDGCGEFMPSADDDDVALRCAACDCHRNFHRRELDSAHDCKAALRKAPRSLAPMPTVAPRLSHLALQYSAHSMSPLAMAAAMSAGEATDSDDPTDAAPGIMHVGQLTSSAAQKLKRFRTKFSSEQKDQMCAFSEKLGWRIQKHDEPAVQEFCSSVGVKRHVLKVWMHNNKHTMGKKLLP